MTVEQMRKHVMLVYDNITWKRRVEKMRDNQVMALYFTFLEQGKLHSKNKPIRHQMTLEDYGISLKEGDTK